MQTTSAWTVQKTVEIPQVQCFDRVVDAPAAVLDEVWTSLRICSDAGREKGRILRHFLFLVGIFGVLDGAQFLLCVVEGWCVALTSGVEPPGVKPSRHAN